MGGTSGTPAVEGNRLYLMSGEGRLFALDTQSGVDVAAQLQEGRGVMAGSDTTQEVLPVSRQCLHALGGDEALSVLARLDGDAIETRGPVRCRLE